MGLTVLFLWNQKKHKIPPRRIASLCLSYQARSWGSIKTSYACWIKWNFRVTSSIFSGFLSVKKCAHLMNVVAHTSYICIKKLVYFTSNQTYLDATSVPVSDMTSLFLRQLLPWKPPRLHNGISWCLFRNNQICKVSHYIQYLTQQQQYLL